MTVTDPRFGAELVTDKGRVYVFDDIDCLAAFVGAGSVPEGRIHSLWVNDFNDPERRLDATTALFWRNPKLRSPMASGIVAFAPGADAGSAAASLETWQQIVTAAGRSPEHAGHRPVQELEDTASIAAPASQQADIVVNPTGPIRSLTAALRLARPHARIVVRPGRYQEPRIVIDRPVSIQGQGWPTFVGGEHEVISVTADSVTLRGLVIEHVAGSAAEDRAGIRFTRVRHCAVENSRLFDTFFGIYLAESSDCRIAGNTIRGQAKLQGLSGNAVHSWNSRDLTIEDNELSGHRDGIYLEFTTGSRIRRNQSTGNLRYGLHFMFSHHCEYRENVFTRNGAGVAVMFSDSVTMSRNRFEHSWGSAAYGLLLKELRDSRIESNRFDRNTVGLWTEGTTRVVVTGNDFIGNGWAVRVLGDAVENRFQGNRFLANSFDVGTAAGRNDNMFQANYWDRYRGYDLNRDGFGDVPYQPVGLFSFLVQENEPALILLHSFFIDLLEVAERAVPVLAPETLADHRPLMRPEL